MDQSSCAASADNCGPPTATILRGNFIELFHRKIRMFSGSSLFLFSNSLFAQIFSLFNWVGKSAISAS